MGNREYFARIPHALIDDPDLDAYAQGVYTVVRRHADFGKQTGAFVSDRTIAEKLGCDRRTVLRRRKLLREKGWLDWHAANGKVNRYLVYGAPDQAVTHGHNPYAPESQAGDIGSHPPVTHGHTTKKQDTERQYQEDGLAEVKALKRVGELDEG